MISLQKKTPKTKTAAKTTTEEKFSRRTHCRRNGNKRKTLEKMLQKKIKKITSNDSEKEKAFFICQISKRFFLTNSLMMDLHYLNQHFPFFVQGPIELSSLEP